MKKIFPFLLALLIFLPLTASAALPGFGQIVPEVCKTCPCGWGGVMAIIQNVVNFIIALSVIFATIIIVWAGGLYILSPTNPESRSTANKMLINAFIGLLIVLSAWLIVDFVMKTLYGGQFGPWNSILTAGSVGESCVVAKSTSALFTGNIVAVPGQGIGLEGGGGAGDSARPGSVATNGGCTGNGTNASCVSLSPAVPCEASGCKVDSGLKNALATIPQGIGPNRIGWAVTEGYPPSRNHQAQCHSNGTCVDVALRPRNYTFENIAHVTNAFRGSGVRIVFESSDCTLVNQVKNAGGLALCLNSSQISAPHFSVYAR